MFPYKITHSNLGMKISADKSKTGKMGSCQNVTVKIEREELDTVNQFKYLGSTIKEIQESQNQNCGGHISPCKSVTNDIFVS